MEKTEKSKDIDLRAENIKKIYSSPVWKKLSAQAKTTLTSLYNFEDESGGFPTPYNLRKITGLPQKDARLAVHELRDIGLVLEDMSKFKGDRLDQFSLNWDIDAVLAKHEQKSQPKAKAAPEPQPAIEPKTLNAQLDLEESGDMVKKNMDAAIQDMEATIQGLGGGDVNDLIEPAIRESDVADIVNDPFIKEYESESDPAPKLRERLIIQNVREMNVNIYMK